MTQKKTTKNSEIENEIVSKVKAAMANHNIDNIIKDTISDCVEDGAICDTVTDEIYKYISTKEFKTIIRQNLDKYFKKKENLDSITKDAVDNYFDRY